jgi:hypothetical protein
MFFLISFSYHRIDIFLMEKGGFDTDADILLRSFRHREFLVALDAVGSILIFREKLCKPIYAREDRS